jgi:hypothetical protein
VCPQYGSVNIIYSNVKEMDCAAIGQPLYSNAWGRQSRGCTPLISRHGSLVDRGFSWGIAYNSDGDRKRLPAEEPLLFDDSSACKKGAAEVSCSELHQGQRVFVQGTRSGVPLTVVKVDAELGERAGLANGMKRRNGSA